ncbi:MAG: hypothetical protein R3E79_62285 [Caldilineaceae bacterium]
MTNKPSKLIDSDLYRQAQEEYRQWNALETEARLNKSEPLSSSQAWYKYVDLVEFCWRLHPEQSEWQRVQKLAALERYYKHLQQFESWRETLGKTA